MASKKWFVIALAALFVLAGCDKKAPKSTAEKPVDEKAKAESEKADEKDEAEQEKKAETEKAAPEEQADTGTDETDAAGEQAASTADLNPVLLDPSKADKKAPDQFKAKFVTTKGDFVIEFHRDWSPHGVDRVYNLIKADYYDDIAFFRIIEGFMAQFGIHGHPAVNEVWKEATIQDDPVKKSNTRGFVTMAQRSEPNTRTTHMFINYGNNAALDKQGFAPIGKVVEGMGVVEKLYAGYGEGAPRGSGPSQKLLMEQGNAYLKDNFPKLDYIKDVQIVE